jgi:regulator of protease activity HflC (stomatin/prohibitin superfamily)
VESALAWLSELINWFGKWVPRIFQVRISERAVKYVRGRAFVMGPGLHVYWPITSEIDHVFVTRQVIKLQPQVVKTKDGASIEVGGLLVYEIEDAYKYLVDNYEAQDSAAVIALGAMRRAIGMRTFEQLRENRADIDNTLAAQAQRRLESLGVKVESLEITDLAETNVLSIFTRDGHTKRSEGA